MLSKPVTVLVLPKTRAALALTVLFRPTIEEFEELVVLATVLFEPTT
jgi:hypothetical protein